MAISKDKVAAAKKKTTQQAEIMEAPQTAAQIIEEEEAATARKKKNEQTRRTKQARAGRAQIAVWVDQATYDSLKRLSNYRAGRDDKAEGSSLQGIVNIAMRQYLETCKEELAAWDAAQIPIK